MTIKRFRNPFFPEVFVKDPNRFEGRQKEVEEIVEALFQTVSGSPKNIIITGERGVGKSSLLYQTRSLSKGKNELAERFNINITPDKFQFISVWVDATSGQSLENLIQNIIKELNSDLKNVFNNIKIELEIGGIIKLQKKSPEEKSITDLVREFVFQIKKVHKKLIEKKKHGLIIFIDELDRLDSSCGIASFLKLTIETFWRENIENIVFFTAGIKGAIQKFENEHASILRSFRDIPLETFEFEDAKAILQKGFELVGRSYNSEIFIPAFKFSNGFPEPIQLIGYEILRADSDSYLDKADLYKAINNVVSGPRRNSLESKLISVRGPNCQHILREIAEYHEMQVPRVYLSQKLSLDFTFPNKDINLLIEKGIIYVLWDGYYSFADPFLKEYIKHHGIIE